MCTFRSGIWHCIYMLIFAGLKITRSSFPWPWIALALQLWGVLNVACLLRGGSSHVKWNCKFSCQKKSKFKKQSIKLLCFRMLLHPWLMPRLGAMLMMSVSFFLHYRLVYTEGDTAVLLHTKWQNHKNLPMWGKRKLSEAWVLQYMQ